jgi:nicotinamide-nucleotide amidase
MMLFRKKRTAKNTVSRTLKTYGLSESAIREKLKSVPRTAECRIDVLSHPKGVDLTIVVEGEGERILNDMVDAVESRLRKRLGEYVFGTNNDKMERVVEKALTRRRMTLAVAESCTGGLICHWLTNVPGSSECFKQGIIAYGNSAKTSLLRLPEETLKKFGAVSKETVEAMAKGVREVSSADIGIATTGIAGPGGGTTEKPVGLTYIGLAQGSKVVSEKHHFSGGRELIKIQAAQAALDFARRNLVSADCGEENEKSNPSVSDGQGVIARSEHSERRSNL